MTTEDVWSHPLVEAALWALPLVLAIVAWSRAGRRRRAGWALVALALATIVLDKLADLHRFVLWLGSAFVTTLDPEHHFRGETLVLRLALLGGLFAAAVVGLLALTRLDRAMRPAKWVALGGLVLVMALLAARLVPGLAELARGPGKALEALAWGIVVAASARGLRPAPGAEDEDDDFD